MVPRAKAHFLARLSILEHQKISSFGGARTLSLACPHRPSPLTPRKSKNRTPQYPKTTKTRVLASQLAMERHGLLGCVGKREQASHIPGRGGPKGGRFIPPASTVLGANTSLQILPKSAPGHHVVGSDSFLSPLSVPKDGYLWLLLKTS